MMKKDFRAWRRVMVIIIVIILNAPVLSACLRQNIIIEDNYNMDLNEGKTNITEEIANEREPLSGKEKNLIRDISTMELVKEMGLGINIGNTFEACGDWIDKTRGITAFETAWGGPIVTEEMVAGYSRTGFRSVRIPVAWSNLMSEDYIISRELLARVREVVDYVINNGMYALLNIHWDGGWFEKFPEDYEGCIKKYISVWTQISEYFKDYSDYLMFESLNEEGGWSSVWNTYANTTKGKTESYGMLNDINQTFVNIIRASGGNNAKRHLLIAGYNTNIDHTIDLLFQMPDDPEERCAVSVHYYTPSDFAIIDKDASWAKARDSWGTAKDLKELEKYMDMAKSNFVDKGIPVIIGEYGVALGNKTEEMARYYLSAVCEAAYIRSMCPMLWATPGALYDRENNEMYDSLLADEYKRIAAIER